eukprot:TRINITY_DN5057_c0_g1_i1.p1 TRINITY_DN5057_c0_g1~~TRINITY_DN5057_c0_g1_i1.p1  ORF type:complete len:207 (+),score=57.24 TRINITY_DN5057_c0_g1_i1:75-695(+)
MAVVRNAAIFLALLTGTSRARHSSELGLSCGATGACDEFEVEMAEEELAAEMQVELLQRMPVDIKLAASGVVAKAVSELKQAQKNDLKSLDVSCAVDHLVGSWKVENALGIDGVVVTLQVSPRLSTDCDSVMGEIHYLGKNTQYAISAVDKGDGKLHVKYLNDQAEPEYFHEGEFDVEKGVLVEDLGAVNGERQNENMLLQFSRAQ